MPKFQWEGVTKNGDIRRGVVEANNSTAAANRLRSENITPKKIRKKGIGDINITIGTGVTPKDLIIFTRQLATMIDAGLPLVQCLEILGSQSPNRAFASILENVRSQIESGKTFSEALARHPKVFSELYVNLVAAGEAGGVLDTILNRLCMYIEKADKLKRQFRSALSYPIVIFCVAVLVVAVMLIKVIPVFEEMYSQFEGAELPKPTQVESTFLRIPE